MKANANGPSGPIDRTPPGQPPRLGGVHHAALIKMIEQGPDPQRHGVGRWRLIDLARRLEEDFQLEVSIQTPSRELRRLGCRKPSARPRHQARDPLAQEAFKKGASLQSC